jgi:hypothetical protein
VASSIRFPHQYTPCTPFLLHTCHTPMQSHVT